WERGERPRAEQYAPRVPAGDVNGLVELVFLEFCLAGSAGLEPDLDDYCLRFPDLAERLVRLHTLRGAFPSSQFLPPGGDGPPTGLDAGDEIGPYHLVRELGQGGFARVFLARQTD